MEQRVHRLEEIPAHLGPGGRVEVLPHFTGSTEWYQAYGDATADDGPDGRLLSWHRFDESWTSWEMHPAGDEVVLCVEGEVSLIQDIDGEPTTTVLRSGEWCTNPPGVWHTADIAPGAYAVCVFITPGLGTEGRER
jgi:mannose-6-phosphate isomerase-like protein (cupin superfamily)